MSFSLPALGGDYLLFFGGESTATEKYYSIFITGTGASRPSGSTNSQGINTNVFEPNDTEETATVIEENTLYKAYLHKNDIDFYRYSTSGRLLPPLPAPTGLRVSHPSGDYTMSWNSVSGASQYKVYYKDQSVLTPDNRTSYTVSVRFDPISPYWSFSVAAINADGVEVERSATFSSRD